MPGPDPENGNVKAESRAPKARSRAAGRERPLSPVVAVGAVIVQNDRAVIVRRRHAPGRGEWTLPGGRVEWGEALVEAVRREMREETGLDVVVGPVVELFERIERSADGGVTVHFVVVDYICAASAGTLHAGDDAEVAVWVGVDELAAYRVGPHAADVIRRALALEWPR